MVKNRYFFLLIFITVISFSGCSLDVNDKNTSNGFDKNKNVLDSSHNTSSNQNNIELVAYNFFFSQNVITVKKDSKVTINLTSADGQHDILIDGYNIQSTVSDINNKTSITFIADKVGEFDFYSTIGNQKELGLNGKLIVEE